MTSQASEVDGLHLAEGSRNLQLGVRAKALADVAKAWPLLRFDDLDATWTPWLQVMSAILNQQHAESARLAALYYTAARQLTIGEPGRAVMATAPSPDWIARGLGYAAVSTYARNVNTVSPERAVNTALTTVLGTAARIALDGGRSTVRESVHADDKALGFYRITDGDPCYFCAMLASRGLDYKTRQSAGELDDWHNDCGCSVAAAFTANPDLPELSREASSVYGDATEGVSGKDKARAFRTAWTNRPR